MDVNWMEPGMKCRNLAPKEFNKMLSNLLGIYEDMRIQTLDHNRDATKQQLTFADKMASVKFVK